MTRDKHHGDDDGQRPDPDHATDTLDNDTLSALHFRVAFECAPLGMMLLQEHTVVACNQALCDLFELAESRLLGARFNTLFPGGTSFEAIQSAMHQALAHGGRYRETRLMQPLDADTLADSPVRQVSLQFVALDASRQLTLCSVESASVPLVDHDSLTPREREVASLLRERYTAKEIGRSLGISHRTVEIYRTRLMKKYGVRNAAGLVRALLREPDAADGPEPVAAAVPPCTSTPMPTATPATPVAAAQLPPAHTPASAGPWTARSATRRPVRNRAVACEPFAWPPTGGTVAPATPA